MKRLMDIAFSLLGLLLLWPFLVAALLLVRATSPGPGLFRQQRVGRDQKPFVCNKLRTMRIGTAETPTHLAPSSAITPVGRILRASKLDELPQLYNVLVGDMSLVGPRPCLPTQRELISARVAHGVFRIRPGITGLAQITGVDMSDPERLAAVDADYIRTRTLAGDLRLLLATVLRIGQPKPDPSPQGPGPTAR